MGLLSMWVMFGTLARAARFSAGVPSPGSLLPATRPRCWATCALPHTVGILAQAVTGRAVSAM
jgi:hypothetical protein